MIFSISKRVIIILLFLSSVSAFSLNKQKIFIFTSFAMSDEALKSYFAESKKVGAQLIMRGLINNSFAKTKEKTMKLGISFNIDPGLFEKYKVDVVPVIIVDDGKGSIKKLTGHIPLSTALEIMENNTP